MYELIITEKPNASRKVAQALADTKPIKKDFKKAPFYELKHKGKDIIVGCAVGHLYGLHEKVKSKGFAYPVFDVEWRPSYENSRGAAFSKKYLEALIKLAKKADVITIATDYDVEGEVIGLNIVRYACKKKDARRMKFSTLTKADLVEAYENASPTLDWGQANAGETRHFLDFYYGINLSRALTKAIKAGGMFKILSTGRVQGPALKIVADREKEINAFEPTPYWQISLNVSKNKKVVEAWHEKDKFWDEKEAKAVMSAVAKEKESTVSDISSKQFKQQPPHPFDLTSLQTESYRLFSISPKQTLSIAQDLYTQGAISYPRTSSQQLDAKLGFKKILKELQKLPAFTDLCTMLLAKKSLTPNNGKKKDPAHPAIYPTGVKPKTMEGREGKVYDLISKRFFATFGDPAIRETMKVIFDVNQELFVTKGTRTVARNWHTYYMQYVKLEEIELPSFKKGEKNTIKKIKKLADQTKPPKRFTPASLIKMLEKQGLGTKATRAEIVETLKKRNYVNHASIEVTELGMEIAQILEKHSPKILQADLTKKFEEDMEAIRAGTTKPAKVLKEARDFLNVLLDDFKNKEAEIGEELKKTYTDTRASLTTVGACQKCKEGKLIIRTGRFGKFIACDKYPDCKTIFSLPSSGLFEVIDKICEACNHPEIKVIKRGKRPQDVCINPECPTKAVPNLKEYPCEKCKTGTMIIKKSMYGAFFACNKYPKCRSIKRIKQKDS